MGECNEDRSIDLAGSVEGRVVVAPDAPTSEFDRRARTSNEGVAERLTDTVDTPDGVQHAAKVRSDAMRAVLLS